MADPYNTRNPDYAAAQAATEALRQRIVADRFAAQEEALVRSDTGIDRNALTEDQKRANAAWDRAQQEKFDRERRAKESEMKGLFDSMPPQELASPPGGKPKKPPQR